MAEVRGYQSSRKEQVALNKESNPYQEPYPVWHQTGVDRLERIFKQGIISGNEARKLKIRFTNTIRGTDYWSNTNAPYNLDHISLSKNLSPTKIETPNVGLMIDESRIVMLDPRTIDHGITADSYLYPKDFEVWVSGRIAPQAITGLIIGETPTYEYMGNKRYETPPANPKGVIEVINEINPNLAVPIYFKNEMIWPRKI